MSGTSKACWLAFTDWLEAGAPGVPPATLRLAYGGSVWRLLPLARQSAAAVGPWLLALLAARQRAGLVGLAGIEAAPAGSEASTWLASDLQARPLGAAEQERQVGWAQWALEAELLRVIRLVEASSATLPRPGWLAWETRYWALAVSLARLGQLYAELAQRVEGDPSDRWLLAAERVWLCATRAEGRAA